MLRKAWRARRRGLRLGPGRRARQLELDRGRGGFGDEVVAVEDSQAVADVVDRERPLEGRGRAQGHLGVAVEQGGDAAARVTAVGRSVGPVEAGLYRQVLHRG